MNPVLLLLLLLPVAAPAVAEDYGISRGGCDVAAVRARPGGQSPSLLGMLLGARMDEADRTCIGVALEAAHNGARVRWVNPASKVTYAITPGRSYENGGQACREFVAEASTAVQSAATVARACRTGGGAWRLVDT